MSAIFLQVQDVATPQISWVQILDDLRGHGYSGYRVALAIGVGRSTVQGWREAKGDIGYGYGIALMRLHAKACGWSMTFQRLTEAEKRR